jgi:hypothetical protein
METAVVVLGALQIISASLLIYVVIKLGQHDRAILKLFKTDQSLLSLAKKSNEIFQLLGKFVSKGK